MTEWARWKKYIARVHDKGNPGKKDTYKFWARDDQDALNRANRLKDADEDLDSVTLNEPGATP